MKRDYFIFVDAYVWTMKDDISGGIPEKCHGSRSWEVRLEKKTKKESLKLFKHLLEHISEIEGHHGVKVKRQKRRRIR